ncbi:PilZ domain-containing protein [Cellulomonas sp. SLBN-39]|uniref:PilZ domain-containing protein n=1 Tax=Cellulomonas sp. SLBN-39 TaxID=2768446 RepID=UPI00114E40C7|nr:PilZ domain-containing protein [Cellulomonas sp. SLBN-39]
MSITEMEREVVEAAAGIPHVNQRVRVVLDPDAAEPGSGVPTRVEDVEVVVDGTELRHHVLVSPPWYGGDVEPPAEDSRMTLVWPTERGVLELPVRFVRIDRMAEGVRGWRLVVVGSATRLQRRQFVRVPVGLPVSVETRPEDSGTPRHPVADGMTIDLSEGGLRCVLHDRLPDEHPVTVTFAFGEAQFRLAARVVRAAPWVDRRKARVPGARVVDDGSDRQDHDHDGPDDDAATGAPGTVPHVRTRESAASRWSTAIRFVDPDEAGPALRRAIFAEQVRMRRTRDH